MKVPEEVDGKVVQGIFEEEYRASNPVELSNYSLKWAPTIEGKRHNYESQESQKIEESLRGLGYVD
jgi:hypothetical protein